MNAAAPCDTVPPMIPQRSITGMSAILLPMASATEPDWQGFCDHVGRTVAAGLTPAINMDTGYANLIDEQQRRQALELAREVCAGTPFVGGVFVGDRPGDAFNFDAYRRGSAQVTAAGGMPILFQSYGLTGQAEDEIVEAYRLIGEHVDRYLAFELGQMFAPFGRIYSLDVFRQLLGISSCVGAKHSSLSRDLEWQRLAIRDEHRPDFKVLTGNDLAIDMVMYGSDYLLGLSTFAPEEFARRDEMWEHRDPGFYELNDVLQYLGCFAFRNPVPAYKHSAAQFLHLRQWINQPLTFPGSPTRPDSDVPILEDILQRLSEC